MFLILRCGLFAHFNLCWLTCMQFVVNVNKGIYLPTFENHPTGGIWAGASLTGGHEGALCQDRSTAMVKAGGEWPCSSMGVDEMNKIWCKMFTNFGEFIHWQF